MTPPEGADLTSLLRRLPRPEGVAVLPEAASVLDAPAARRLWVVTAAPDIDGAAVTSARVSGERGHPIVTMTLDTSGAACFEALTERLVAGHVAVVVDGEVLTAPRVEERIGGGEVRVTLGATKGAGLGADRGQGPGDGAVYGADRTPRHRGAGRHRPPPLGAVKPGAPRHPPARSTSEGLRIADAAIIPSSLGVPSSLTVAALAERVGEDLVATLAAA